MQLERQFQQTTEEREQLVADIEKLRTTKLADQAQLKAMGK